VKYPIVVHKDSDSDYGVTVPDLPGCYSAGATMEEAMESAREAILTHVEGLLMDNEHVPSPSSVESLMSGRSEPGAVWAIVDVDLSVLSDRSKRVNITVPERLLRRIDAFAEQQGDTRSGLLVAAAIEYITSRQRAS